MYEHSSVADLEQCAVQSRALANAAMRELFALLRELEKREVWKTDGCVSMEHWVSYRFVATRETARRWVESARALESLPAVGDGFASGAISEDALTEVVAFATPETDQEIAREAPASSIAYLRMKAREARRITREEADRLQRKRSLRTWWDQQTRMLMIRGQLPEAEGALVEKALERIAATAPLDPLTGTFDRYDVRCADALVELASSRIAADADADRATIVAHTDDRTIAGEANGVLENGIELSSETVRRLGCDARVQAVTDRSDGTPIGVGRTSRKIPAWLLRQLRHRDGGCAWPGCGRQRWLHAHHIRHWADGGATDSDNLLLLCGYHHRLVHEGGWKIRVSPSGRLRFVRPDGYPLAFRPLNLRPEIRERFFEASARAP